MIKLYGNIGTASAAIEAALAEAGVEYELVIIDTKHGEHLGDGFRTINPRQQVPALQLSNGSVVTETAAILLYLVDAFPECDLAPKPGTAARAQHDRWLMFMASNIYEGELRKAYPDRYTDSPIGAAEVQSSAASYVRRHYEILDTLIKGPYLFGANLTAVDIFLWVLSSWMDQDWIAANCPKVSALASTVRERPLVAPIHFSHFG